MDEFFDEVDENEYYMDVDAVLTNSSSSDSDYSISGTN